jgi:hypothetical protein
MEIAHDPDTVSLASIGRAFYAVYGNLSAALQGYASLLCPGEEGLATMRVVEELVSAAAKVRAYDTVVRG